MKRIFSVTIAFVLTLAVFSQETRKIKITELEKMVAESKTPLVIKFWATFCKPCMEEIPYFQTMAKKFEKEGVRMLLVSLDMKDDYPGKVNAFVKNRKLITPTAWLDETNADYFCPKIDKEWSGAIPATLFINNIKGYRKFTEEPLSKQQLEGEIKALLTE